MKETEAQLKEMVLKAVELTNYCTRHGLYHGQKYKSCTPQERTVIELTNQEDKQL